MNDHNALVKKAQTLSVRLSPEERMRLEISAKKADLSLSQYVRQILIGEASDLDALIATRGRQRNLPAMETVAEIARARIALLQIADGLKKANAIGSKVTLRALIFQLSDIYQALQSIRSERK